MNLLARYILREFLKTSIAILLGIVVLYLSVTFLKDADEFIKRQATLLQISRYYLYTIPGLAAQALPFAALIGTLLSLGALSRHQEITAMKAGGVSLLRITFPVLLGGMMLSVLGFLNNEVVTPAYSARAAHIRNVEVEKKQERVVFQQRKLWLRGPDNSIANIDLVSPDRREMIGVNIFKLNPDFTVRERIRAGQLVWEREGWKLRESLKFTPTGTSVAVSTADGEIYNVVDRPEDMGMIVKDSAEMDFAELLAYVRKLKARGYKAVRYEVDLHSKIASPFACLLMVMIAAPLSMRQARSGGAARGIALAVMIAAIYWALMSGGRALGMSGTLPPLYAAWLANVIFAALAFAALMRMQRQM
jgi:lipopolysaccharide export system permease protein